MPNDEHVAMLGRGAAVWNAWWTKYDETPDLSGAGLRGLDLSGFDLSRADLRGADLRGTSFCDADLSGASLDGAFLYDPQFLNCAQLIVTHNWQSVFRDDTLACGASIPKRQVSE